MKKKTSSRSDKRDVEQGIPPVGIEKTDDAGAKRLAHFPSDHQSNRGTETKMLAHVPPEYQQPKRKASKGLAHLPSERQSNHGTEAKMLAHLPPEYQSNRSDEAKRLAHLPPEHQGPDSQRRSSRRSDRDDAQNLTPFPPANEPSDSASPGAYRLGGQGTAEDYDSNTIPDDNANEATTPPPIAFEVSARLVPEEDHPVTNENPVGNPGPPPGIATVIGVEKKSRLRYMLIGALAIAVIVAIVLGVTLASTGSTPATPAPPTSATPTAPANPPTPTAPAPAPTVPPTGSPRDSMISLVQSRSPSTSFAISSSPESLALDWILSDPFSSGSNLSDDRLVQRFALATIWISVGGANWNQDGWLTESNECGWGVAENVTCSRQLEIEGLDLDLDFNALSGSIPIEIGLMTQLTLLSLHGRNHLLGSIPSQIGSLAQLRLLSLNSNQLAGSIPPELGMLTQLTSLVLHINQLTGSIPSQVGMLAQLAHLDMFGNQMMGSIPSEVGLLIQLTLLGLYSSQLAGGIPSQVAGLSQLTRLGLFNNQLSGSMPSELGVMTQLNWLSLHHNQFTGFIPSEWGRLTQLTQLHLHDNQLIGSLPLPLCELDDAARNVDCREVSCACFCRDGSGTACAIILNPG